MYKQVRETVSTAYNAALDSPRTTRVIGAGLVAAAVLVPAHNRYEDGEQSQADATVRIENLENTVTEQARLLNRVGVVSGGLSGYDKSAVFGTGLDAVTELPGYGQEVTAGQEALMETAAVKLFKRVPGTEYWGTSCSGTYVEIEEQEYVLSAKHCFFAQPAKGAMGPPGVFAGGVDVSQYRASPASRGIVSTPTAEVTGIAYATDADYALLRINDPEASLADELTPVPFDETYGLPAEPGQAVTVYSSPGVASGAVVQGEGVYLGSIDGSPTTPWSYSVDFVGLTKVGTPREDACYFGGSGTSGIVAGGKVLGPVTSRNNIGYPDEPLANTGDNLRQEIGNRLHYEAEMGMDLFGFATVCGFSRANNPAMLRQLVAALDAQ